MCLLLRDAVPHVTGIFLFGGVMDLDIKKWAEENSSYLNYKHFDCKVAVKDVIEDVSNPAYIEKHPFKPFIHFTKEMIKYSKEKGRYSKTRSLYKASHLDACVYQYYSHLLNELYNKKAKELKLNETAIAYRSNIRKNNIHFAKETFDFIRAHPQCTVILSDFTNFFDTLDHTYLKEQLCKLLEVESLPSDFYKIYKSITKYSSVEENELLEYIKENNIKTYSKLLLPMSEMRKHGHLIKSNKNNFGIPQGASISAVLSNIYMMDFDVACRLLLKSYNGLYMRYSDDSIFVFPNTSPSQAKRLFDGIMKIVKRIPNLELSPEKTKVFYYGKTKILNLSRDIGSANTKSFIDYLGFTFDGKCVRIRGKTTSKYYYRVYKKIDTINKNNSDPDRTKDYGTKNLYEIYSAKGTRTSNRRFLSYIQRCEQIFGKDEKIAHILYTHYGKIKRRLKPKITKTGD